jgi:hypothetical protein
MGRALDELLQAGRGGKCFCGKPRGVRRRTGKRADTCGSERCLARWRAAYLADAPKTPKPGPSTAKRDIVRVVPDPDHRGRVFVHLACAHSDNVFRSQLKRGQKRRGCHTCEAQQNAVVHQVLDQLNAGHQGLKSVI